MDLWLLPDTPNFVLHISVNLGGKNSLACELWSSIPLLIVDSNHHISDDSFKILSNSTVLDLKVLESLYIHKLQPNLNDYNSSFDLHIVK